MINSMAPQRPFLRGLWGCAIMSLCCVAATDGCSTSEHGNVTECDRHLGAANWDIEHSSLAADLGDNATDLLMNFSIGQGREYEVELLALDCEDNITSMNISVVDPVVSPMDVDHESLALGYNFDKSMLEGSNIWSENATASTAKIEFCHVLKLVLPVNGSSPMVIAEDKRNVVIDVDLSADFKFAQGLVEGEMGEDEMGMKFRGLLSISNLAPPNDEKEREVTEAFEKSMRDNVGAGLGEGQSMVNVTVLSIEVDPAQKISQFNYELVFAEDCDSCEEKLEDKAMYDNVTAHMTQEFNNGGFISSLKSFLLFATRYLTKDSYSRRKLEYDDIYLTDYDFTEPEMFVIAGIAKTGQVFASVDVNSYIEACKCDGALSFTCNSDTALSPNSELFVCIKSKVSGVEVDYLDSMVLTQESTTLDVIKANGVKNPGFSSREYVPSMKGVAVAVSTRVPQNLFSFGTDDSLTITGVVTMKLAGTERRGLIEVTRVKAVTGGTDVEQVAPFQLQVNLEGSPKTVEQVKVASSVDVASWGFIVKWMLFSLVYQMQW